MDSHNYDHFLRDEVLMCKIAGGSRDGLVLRRIIYTKNIVEVLSNQIMLTRTDNFIFQEDQFIRSAEYTLYVLHIYGRW